MPKKQTKETALMRASERGDLKIVKAIIDASIADINAKNKEEMTALMFACSKGDSPTNTYLHTVQELLKAGADVNLQNKNKETALAIAASYGDYEIVQSLIAAGAQD